MKAFLSFFVFNFFLSYANIFAQTEPIAHLTVEQSSILEKAGIINESTLTTKTPYPQVFEENGIGTLKHLLCCTTSDLLLIGIKLFHITRLRDTLAEHNLFLRANSGKNFQS